MTIRVSLIHRAAAVAIVCLAGTTGAAVQTKPPAGPDEGELLAYRLSIPTLHKIEGAMKTVGAAAKGDPAVKRQLSSDAVAVDPDTQRTLSAMEKELANVPVLVKALQAHGLTPREYAKFMIVLGRATVASSFQQAGGSTATILSAVAPENIKFVSDHRADIEGFTKTMESLDR
jgi:hypothetical protein